VAELAPYLFVACLKILIQPQAPVRRTNFKQVLGCVHDLTKGTNPEFASGN